MNKNFRYHLRVTSNIFNLQSEEDQTERKKEHRYLFLYNAQIASFENRLLFKKKVLVFFLSSSELQWHKVIIDIGPSREKMFRKKTSK